MNEQEIKEFYKKTFNTVADGYDNPAMRFFPESAAHIPAILDLKGDEHILDVATGTGIVALTLARKLPHGHVTGIDFSRGMLSRAQKKKEQAGITNITFHEMDMQAIDLPDAHFSAAVCSFGIFFLDDMVTQMRHIADQVVPDGKVLITSFYEDSFTPLSDLFFERLRKYGVDPPTLSWKRVSTEDRCVSLFEGVGLRDISCQCIDHSYYLEKPSDWWYIVWNGGFRGLVNRLSDEDQLRFKQEHLDEITGLSAGEGIRLEMKVLYTVGTRSA